MRKLFLLVFLSCFSIALFADFLNVETLPRLRTLQYQKNPYDRIVVFSAPRTGSSVVYNVFRFLFEKKKALAFAHNDFRLDRSVLKTHNILKTENLQRRPEKTLYVVTIRDPIQSCLSTYRIRTKPIDDVQALCQFLVGRLVKYFTFIEQLQKSGCAVAILRYEDFEQRPSPFLCDFIESHFHLSISETDRRLLEIGYSRENISANTRSLADFREFLPLSGFHGKHVSSGPWTPPAEALYWINHFCEAAKPLFQKYGY